MLRKTANTHTHVRKTTLSSKQQHKIAWNIQIQNIFDMLTDQLDSLKSKYRVMNMDVNQHEFVTSILLININRKEEKYCKMQYVLSPRS